MVELEVLQVQGRIEKAHKVQGHSHWVSVISAKYGLLPGGWCLKKKN